MNKFVTIGELRGAAKAVGKTVISADYKDGLSVKKWGPENKEWTSFTTDKVSSLALNEAGNAFKIDYNSNKIFV